MHRLKSSQAVGNQRNFLAGKFLRSAVLEDQVDQFWDVSLSDILDRLGAPVVGFVGRTVGRRALLLVSSASPDCHVDIVARGGKLKRSRSVSLRRVLDRHKRNPVRVESVNVQDWTLGWIF